MASGGDNVNNDYRKRLRSGSTNIVTLYCDQKHQRKRELYNPKMEGENKDTSTSSTQATQTDSPKEVPIVEMEDFEVVDLGDKLNLLMSAVNKINTGLHVKFEALQKQLTDEKGVVPRLSLVEKHYEELDARVEEAEAVTATVPGLNTKIVALEEKVLKL